MASKGNDLRLETPMETVEHSIHDTPNLAKRGIGFHNAGYNVVTGGVVKGAFEGSMETVTTAAQWDV